MISPGQQVWSLQSGAQSYGSEFSSSGRLQPLGNRFARTVTWGQLLAASPDKAEIESYMRQKRVNQNDVAATASYQLQRAEVGFAVDWAYGLTKRWMIGFQVPLTYLQTKVNTRVEMMPELATGAGQKPSGQSLLSLSRGDLRGKISDLARDELTNSGYDAIPEQKNSWDWGDINLMSQILLHESYRWTWSVQQLARLPSSRNPSVADYLQTRSDDGNVDLGLTSLLDYQQRRWLLGLRFGLVAQLPDSIRMRVPASRLRVDPNVARDLGDWIWGAVDAEYRLSSRTHVNFGYSYLAKEPDRYKGGSTEAVTYAQVAEDSSQELHRTRVEFSYRLGGGHRRSGVENKWIASAGYTYPWLGRNSADASRASVELTSYF